jgi:hypothetical protein
METQEIWLNSKMLDGYKISISGKVINTKGKLLKSLDNGRGYIRINVSNKTYYIHRLVADAFIPNPLNKPAVNHIDGNKANNHVSNLEWVTHSENSIHAISTGLNNCRGESNTRAKLSNQDAINIINDSRKLKEIALDYGVSYKKISDIKKGRLYSIATGINYNPNKKYQKGEIGVYRRTRDYKRILKNGEEKVYHIDNYTARIYLNNKELQLGSFPATEEGKILAAMCYDKKAKELFGDSAKLNFD